MIRRVVMLVILVAISGLLVFGAVHRTQSVLASEGRRSGTVEVQASGSEVGVGGHGGGAGLGNGSGRGAGGNGQGRGGGDGQGAGGNEAGGY